MISQNSHDPGICMADYFTSEIFYFDKVMTLRIFWASCGLFSQCSWYVVFVQPYV